MASAVAALSKGGRFVGADIDPDAVETARRPVLRKHVSRMEKLSSSRRANTVRNRLDRFSAATGAVGSLSAV
jgi:ribosomal protein L11 methylase PrmA